MQTEKELLKADKPAPLVEPTPLVEAEALPGAEILPETAPQAVSDGIRQKIRDFYANINWRLLSADLAARASYSITTGTVMEAIAGMDAKEIAISRAIALPLTMSTARIYSRFRDWPLNRYGITKNDYAKFIASNMLTYMVFYCTQYAAIRYWVVGASLQETAIATSELFVASFPLGAVYGYWLEFVRSKIFRVAPQDRPPAPASTPPQKTLQEGQKE